MKGIIYILLFLSSLVLSSKIFSQTCLDGIQNGNETGVDCGGNCPPCSTPCQVTLTSQVPSIQGGCCSYLLEMFDSFGDGWNGASMSIVVNGVTYGPYSATGYGTEVSVPVCDGQVIVVNYLAAGSWPSECSYSISDGEGNLVFQDGPNPVVGNNLFIGNGVCFTPGVLDCNGGQISLIAEGQGASILAFDNDFDFGNAGTGWTSNVAASFDNPCDASIDGGTYMWMGSSAQHPRIIQTVPLDLSCGGEICFYLDFATQGAPSPCEGIDLPNEGVYLEFSTNGGASWTTLEYFGPAGVGNNTQSGGTSPQMTSWNQYCYTIPAAAQTSATIIHWAQTGSSGAQNDHWGLDNVTITSIANCQPYWYNYTYTPQNVDNPLQSLGISSTSTYNVVYTNGSDSCATSITVNIPPCPCPVATISGGGNYCSGDTIPTVDFDITGNFPVTLFYAIDGIPQSPLTVYSDTSLIDPIDGVYTILSITDTTLCSGSFSGSATVGAFPSPIIADLNGGGQYCDGETIDDITISVIGTGLVSIFYSIDGLPQPIISDSSSFNLGNTPGEYILIILSDDGCATQIQDTIIIGLNPVPTADPSIMDNEICEGDSLIFASSIGFDNYQWAGPGGFVSNDQNPIIANAATGAAGNYSLIVSENGCESTPVNVSIIVNPIPDLNVSNDTVICYGESIALFATGANEITWIPAVSNGVAFIPSGSQVYEISGTSQGCSSTESIIVTVLPLPISIYTASSYSGYAPLSVDFINNSSNANSFIWDFGNGTSNNVNDFSAQFSEYATPGLYYITLTASNGICDSVFMDSIQVVPYPEMSLDIPNVFSPNGDGSNEEYLIHVENGILFRADILNRWGLVMYTIDEVNEGWDGYVNGNPATEGTYFVKYYAKGLDGTEQNGETFFQLVR
jgi:gliding motility-associated-like protein